MKQVGLATPDDVAENGDLASDGRRRRADSGDLIRPRINGLACLGFAKCNNACQARPFAVSMQVVTTCWATRCQNGAAAR